MKKWFVIVLVMWLIGCGDEVAVETPPTNVEGDEGTTIEDEQLKEVYAKFMATINDMNEWQSFTGSYNVQNIYETEGYVNHSTMIGRTIVRSPLQLHEIYSYSSDVEAEMYELYRTDDVVIKNTAGEGWVQMEDVPGIYANYVPAIQEMAMNALLAATDFEQSTREDGLTMLTLSFDEADWIDLFKMMEYRIDYHLIEETITDDHAYLLRNIESVESLHVHLLLAEQDNHFAGYYIEAKYKEFEQSTVDEVIWEETFINIDLLETIDIPAEYLQQAGV